MRAQKAPPGWLDRDALFQHVRNAGLKIDPHTLDTFQKQGLMRPPLRVINGKHGNPGYWSPQQAELLRCLCLAIQQKGATTVAARCILPVWVWLYWGDEHGISLEQVQQIMHTWAHKMQRGLSLEHAHQLAAQCVTQVGNAPEGGVQRAKRELTEIFTRPTMNPEHIIESLAHVFDPGKRPNGPRNLPIRPEHIAGQLQALYRGIEALAKAQPLAPGLWYWARHTILTELSQYAQQQPSFHQDVQGTPLEALFPEETILTRHLYSCADLATMLGIALLGPSQTDLPDSLRHDVWAQRVTMAQVTTTLLRSPLWLPEGQTLIRGLAVEEIISFA